MARGIQVVIDCENPPAQAAFWAEALHYRFPEPPPGFATWQDWAASQGIPEEHRDDFSAVEDPDGKGPRFFFQRVPEKKVAKNRMHVDLNVSGGREVPHAEKKALILAEVERLKKLGASDARGSKEEMGGFWVRMNDPEGNEFCVQ